jgi:predicted esterase
MILEMFVIGMIFTLFFLLLGFSQGNFGFAYLGMFAMLLMGLFLLSGGLQLGTGAMESPAGSHIFITVYESHTTVNDPIINLLANTLFYLPFAGILLTTYLALRQ